MTLSPKKYIFLFLFTLIIKCLWLGFIKIHYHGYATIGKYFAQKGVDSYTYIQPIDNYFENKGYGMVWYRGYPQNAFIPENVTPTFEKAIRTPHYGLFYGFFKLFFEKQIALDALAISQLLIELLSIFALSQMAYSFTKSAKIFYFVFLFYTFSSWTTFYALQIMTDSFTCSFIIFSLYYLFRYFNGRKKVHLFISGLFISYSIAMKPFLIPILFVYFGALIIDFSGKKKETKLQLNRLMILFLSFILVISPWVIRNYFIYKRVVLFTNTTLYPSYKTISAVNNLIRIWGGAMPTWGGSCDFQIAGYFYQELPENKRCRFELPDYVFTNDYSRDSISKLKDEISSFKLNPSDSADDVLSEKINAAAESFRKNKPVYFYVIVPLKMLRTALIHSGSYYIIRGNVFITLIKILQTGIYWISFLLGILGFIKILKTSRRDSFLFLGMFLSMIVILCFYFRIPEWRYFLFFNPLTILLSGYALKTISESKKGVKL